MNKIITTVKVLFNTPQELTTQIRYGTEEDKLWGTSQQLKGLSNELALRELFSASLLAYLNDVNTQNKIRTEDWSHFKINSSIIATSEDEDEDTFYIIMPTLFLTLEEFEDILAKGTKEFAYNTVWTYAIDPDQDVAGCVYCRGSCTDSDSDSDSKIKPTNKWEVDLTKTCPLCKVHGTFKEAIVRYGSDTPSPYNFWETNFSLKERENYGDSEEFEYPYPNEF